MRDHVIVCGLQGVGLRIVEQLHLSGTPVIVVDDDADTRFARILEDWGVRHIRRSAYMGDALLEAGLAHALAVVCVEVKEIHALETALRIRETRPDVRMVVQLANPSVARALERVSGRGSVLDVATLAGPSFVEACLGRNAHDIELAGVQFAVVQVEVVESEKAAHPTFRGHFGNLAPVAIMPATGARWPNAPAATTGLCPATASPCWEPRRSSNSAASTRARSPRSPLRTVAITRRMARQASVVMEEGNKALPLSWPPCSRSSPSRRSSFASPTECQGGHGHLGFLTAAYFTVETVATVGYGDYSFADPGSGHEDLRHRPHRPRRGPGVDRVRPLHQHPGQSAHRALPRPTPGARAWSTISS